MKQAKRRKSDATIERSVDAGVAADTPQLPDADYVEHLLAASAPAACDAGAAQEVAAEPPAQSPDSPLCLPAQCLTRDAVEYRQLLLERLPVRTVTLDVAAVERIDAAFMQVLLAFVRSRPRDCEPVAWVNVNAVFADAARLLGVHTALGIPAAA